MQLIETVSQSLKFFRNMWRWATDTTRGTITDTFVENGQSYTYSFPNAKELEGRVDDFVQNNGVSNALYKTVYVNVETGDDGNLGSSTAPFKTVQRAINAIPEFGGGRIILRNGQEHILSDNDSYTIVGINRKKILITSWLTPNDDNPKPILKFTSFIHDKYPDNTSLLHRLEIKGGSYVWFSRIVFKYPDVVDDKKYSILLYQSFPVMLLGGAVVNFENCETQNLNNYLSVISISRYRQIPLITLYNNTFILDTNNRVINNRSNCTVIVDDINNTTKNPNDDNIDHKDCLVRNKVIDADSGICTNVLSNYNFAD